MYPRTRFEMTQQDLDKIIEACRPTPVMLIGSYSPSSPQENANAAWAELGTRMGFDAMTVQPVRGESDRVFTAVPTETPEQKAARELREQAEKRQAKINETRAEIIKLQASLDALLGFTKGTT